MSPQHDHPVPLDEAALINPTVEDALAQAGMLIHWACSDPELTARFCRWLEHCPGDLSTGLMVRVLAATHAVLEPFCTIPVPCRAVQAGNLADAGDPA